MNQKDANSLMQPSPFYVGREKLAPDPVQVKEALDGWGTSNARAMILDAEVRYLQGEVVKLRHEVEELKGTIHDYQTERADITDGNGPIGGQ